MNERVINVHVNIPAEADEPGATAGQLTALMEKVTHMSEQMDNLVREVAEQVTATDGVITIVGGLKAEVALVRAELAASGVNNERLNQLAADLQASQDRLAAATVVNTPAADIPSEPTPPLVEEIVAPVETPPVAVEPELVVDAGNSTTVEPAPVQPTVTE